MIRVNIDTNEVVRLYNEGWSKQWIAQKFGVDSSTIKSRLLASGITLRDISQSVKSMLNVSEHMRETSGRQRTHEFSTSLFETITPESAYILGFILADGYVSDKRFVITLKESDGEFVGRIMDLIGCHRNLLSIKRELGNAVSLDITSKELCKTIHQWGIISPKNNDTPISDKLLYDKNFWRGVIDGDGTLCLAGDGRKILSLVGYRKVCDGFLSFCHNFNCGNSVHVLSHKNIYSVHLNNKDAVKIANILYRDSAIALPRKYKIYQDVFHNNEALD